MLDQDVVDLLGCVEQDKQSKQQRETATNSCPEPVLASIGQADPYTEDIQLAYAVSAPGHFAKKEGSFWLKKSNYIHERIFTN